MLTMLLNLCMIAIDIVAQSISGSATEGIFHQSNAVIFLAGIEYGLALDGTL